MEQGTKEWLEMRKGYLGASDAPCVMEVGFKTPFQLWKQKLGLAEEDTANDAMRYGSQMEPMARRAYEKHTNNLVAPEVIFHPKNHFMMASLDGLSLDGKIILEIKTSNKEDHALAKQGKIPEKHYPQLQHQLDCLPGSVLHYWSYHKDEGVLVEVKRDEKYIAKLVEEEGKFWKRVQDFDPPPLTDKDYLDFSYDNEWIYLINEAREVDKIEKEIKERKKINREALKRKSGDQNSMGKGAKFTKIIKEGLVDWDSLCRELEISDETRDKFRGPSTETWRLSLSK